MNKIFSKEEYITPAFLEIIQNKSDQPEINEQIFFKISYITHNNFKINLIYVDNMNVGYYIWKTAPGDFIMKFPDLLEVNEKLEPSKEYFFLMNFEIFKQYRNRGYGTKIFSHLKNEQALKGNTLLILANYKSKNFWNKFSSNHLIITFHKDISTDNKS